jgi:hypothetical protein
MKSCVTQICELALKFFILIIDLVHWIVCWIQLVVKDSRIFFRWYHSWSLRFRTPFVLRTHGVHKENDHSWYHHKNIRQSLTTRGIITDYLFRIFLSLISPDKTMWSVRILYNPSNTYNTIIVCYHKMWKS